MTYCFHFELVGSVEIEADNLDEAWDSFNEIDDFSEHVNTMDAYNVVIEENGNFVEQGDLVK